MNKQRLRTVLIALLVLVVLAIAIAGLVIYLKLPAWVAVAGGGAGGTLAGVLAALRMERQAQGDKNDGEDVSPEEAPEDVEQAR